MKKRTTLIVLAAFALVLGAAFSQTAGPGRAAAAPAATAPLSDEAEAALLEALTGPEGEYAAYAVYTAVIERYGAVEPYVSIRDAEAAHIAALQRQLDLYGVDYPKTNPYLGKVEAPDDLVAFAQAGVDAEVANVAMYDRLLAAVADYPNLVQVFTNLQNASQTKHLPAFELAVQNGGTLTPEQLQQVMGPAAGHRGWAPGQGRRAGAGMGRGAGHGQGAAMAAHAGGCTHTPPAWAGQGARR